MFSKTTDHYNYPTTTALTSQKMADAAAAAAPLLLALKKY